MNPFIALLVFAGSVFPYSEKFVNTTNSPKLYFVVIFLFFVTAFFAVSKKRITLAPLAKKVTLRVVYLVCCAQAFYGLLQFVGWATSNHSGFLITGSFDNPAGFAAVLSMTFPIGLFLFYKGKKVERYLVSVGLLVIATSIVLSGSRTGILAILISSFVFFLLEFKLFRIFQKEGVPRLLLVSFAIIFVFGGSLLLYFKKKDSADGRLLIWRVSLGMIKDKPVLGHGYGSFQAEYMHYQADYFKRNPNSKLAILADNVKHPFNEFINGAIEFGLLGLISVSLLLLLVFWKTMAIKDEKRTVVLSGLCSFLIVSSFSYPLHYTAVWLLLSFYLFLPFHTKQFQLTVPVRVLILAVSVLGIIWVSRFAIAEVKWKKIAEKSLEGKTEEMLPEYKRLYESRSDLPSLFLYNYGAELNYVNRFDKSIYILKECEKEFNDYDVQMLLGNNYYQKGKYEAATERYKYASNMIPCRFLPLYQLFMICKETGQNTDATRYAKKIITKMVKIPSEKVSFMQDEARSFLKQIDD